MEEIMLGASDELLNRPPRHPSHAWIHKRRPALPVEAVNARPHRRQDRESLLLLKDGLDRIPMLRLVNIVIAFR
jgi:hypothetical protein